MCSSKDSVGLRLAILMTLLLGATTTSTSAQEVDARALLEKMSAEIASLQSFVIHGDAYADARLDAGQIIEHSSKVSLRLRREPGAVRITNRDAEETKEIYFDDGSLSVYSSADNMYAQAQIPKGVESMLDYAMDEVGIESPLLEFISADVANELLQDADEVSYLEASLIRDQIYHHVGIRSPEVDVQIWISAEGRPLPGKLVITSKWEGGAPRFVAFFEWDTNPTFQRDLFEFEPPDDAVEVEFVVELQN
jgi:hypothetical protein